MAQNVTLYTTVEDVLTREEILSVAKDLEDSATVEAIGERAVLVKFSDLSLTLVPLPVDQLQEHLEGFVGFVTSVVGGDPEPVQPLIDTIMATRSAIGCVVEPGYDSGTVGGGLLGRFKKNAPKPNKAKSLVISMACTYEECMLFADDTIYSPFGELWFGPEGAENYADLSELTVQKLRNTVPETTERQDRRAARVREQLEQWGVPQYPGPIRWMLDDDDFKIHSPQEVARRVIALHAVVCFARGRDREACLGDLKAADVEDELTPKEREFFYGDPEHDQRQSMIWSLECLWMMMWALGHIESFGYPNDMCDVDGLHDLIFEKSKAPSEFIDGASLVDPTELLDRLEFLTRLHWALRQAMIEENPVPENLDWNSPSNMVPMSQNMGVVAERHKALSWISGFGEASWDEADTPT